MVRTVFGSLVGLALWLVVVVAAQAQSVGWTDFSAPTIPDSDVFLVRTIEGRPETPVSATLPLGRWLEAESSVGVDVTRLKPELGLSRLVNGLEPAAGTPYRMIDSNLQNTAVSLDLKLRWPSSVMEAGIGMLRPYFSFGPALFVTERNPFANVLGTLADVAVRIGVKAAAGVSWHLNPDGALFGEFRLIRGVEGPLLSSGGRLGTDNGASGYDLLYGLRLRF